MVSSSSFIPETNTDAIEPQLAPRVVVGAASPLWLMFGGAAVAGAAYWWWASRWREAVNLEALLALAPEPVAPPVEVESIPEVAPEPVLETLALEDVLAPEAVLTAVVDTAETVMDAAEEATSTLADSALSVVEAANEAVAETVELNDEVAVPLEKPPAEVLESAVAAATAGADDLTRLVGVGPKLASALAELGVTSFQQIAAWTPEALAEIDLKLALKGRAERDAWVAQARRFVEAAGAEAAEV